MSAPNTHENPRKTQPLTRSAYIDSLRDSREIWVHGERVGDVTTHPVFRNSAQMFARQYHALHDPNCFTETFGTFRLRPFISEGTVRGRPHRLRPAVRENVAVGSAVRLGGWQGWTCPLVRSSTG